MGGMMGDRLICLTSLLLLSMRGLDKKEVDADVKANAMLWKKETGRSKPRIVDLPWYAFDMHTQAGKIAFNIFMKQGGEKYGLDELSFRSLWFFMESAKVPKHLIRLPPTEWSLTAFDSVWWLPYVGFRLNIPGHTAKEAARLWKEQVREDIKGAVNWILEKRESNE